MNKKTSNVDRVYAQLRQRAVNFSFKPEARLNESALSTEFGASRTPLREALNRLVAEGFLTFKNGRGFFCRSLSPALVLELYEARVAVETEAVRLATNRASDDELAGLLVWLDRVEQETDADAERLLEADEAFHLSIMRLARNKELLRLLTNLNDRVRYIRLIYLKGQLIVVESESNPPEISAHRKIVNAMLARDTGRATTEMRKHIESRRTDAAQAVRIAYSQLYVPDEALEL